MARAGRAGAVREVLSLKARLDRGESLVPAASAEKPAPRGWFAAV